MNISKQITPEYIGRIESIRPIIRGKYDLIAQRAGVSEATVKAVMYFKFKNKDVLKQAEKLARQLTKVYTNV